MEWLNSLLGGESGTAVQLILMVLGLAIILMLIVWIFRRIAGTPARKAARNRVPRLSITDVTAVDDKRFLVLARRDNVEHLILIGGNGDVVVETGIVRSQPAQQMVQQEAPAAKAVAQEPPAEDAKARTTEAKADRNKSLLPELGTVTAAVAATGAAISGAASATTDAVSETATSAASSASSAVETAASKIGDTVASLNPSAEAPTIDASPEPEISVAAEPKGETDAVVSSQQADPIEDLPLELDNLEAELSETLDSALSVDELDVATEAEAPSVASAADTDSSSGSGSDSGEDEMQKLLDELSRETKTPAQ